MKYRVFNKKFWSTIEELVNQSEITIDRPKGSSHPRIPELIYPVDYGYLKGTTSFDGNEVDIWKGTKDAFSIDGVVCTVDLAKKDTEMKILISCTEEEMQMIYTLHNEKSMSAILIKRDEAQ